jgi:phosphomannomutase
MNGHRDSQSARGILAGHCGEDVKAREWTSTIAQEWIAHDPDPNTAAELLECTEADLDERFARALTFGTAGLRGPLRGGPNGMNLAVVLRASWAVAKVLKDHGLHGRDVVVGRDARHGSDEFALAAAEVIAAQGFSVKLMFAAVPTPIVAFAVRHGGAAAGIQITASHNPPTDNGYKVYFVDGFPIVPPIDQEIEQAMGVAPHADEIRRQAVTPSGVNEVQRYIERAAQVRHTHGSVRVAVTPLHGVGGEFILDTLVRAGFSDVHVVDSQFAPDPDFPTVALPNPEEPGAVDAVLKLAADVDADIAVALDPDADRCAVGVPTPDGWRMLSGDETGWLLGDYILSQVEPGPVMAATVVASSMVSSRMLSAIALEHGACHVQTLTGFKWLSRADIDLPACTLVYAYEEAIGHCVDPASVRDKDGISAAVLVCDLAVALKHRGHTVLDALDDLARRHGVHTTSTVSRQVADADEAEAVMGRIRKAPPEVLAGLSVAVSDLRDVTGPLRTDAVVLSGGDGETTFRVVVRPSGTEPKVKSYIEVRCGDVSDLGEARLRAATLLAALSEHAQRW